MPVHKAFLIPVMLKLWYDWLTGEFKLGRPPMRGNICKAPHSDCRFKNTARQRQRCGYSAERALLHVEPERKRGDMSLYYSVANPFSAVHSLLFFISHLSPPPSSPLSFSPWHSDTYQVAGTISKMLRRWFWNSGTDHSIIPCVSGGDLWESVEC